MISMSRKVIEEKVIEAVEREFGTSAVALDVDFNKLGFNSLQRVRLIFVLEEALNVDLADLNLHECQTLHEVVDRLDRATTV